MCRSSHSRHSKLEIRDSNFERALSCIVLSSFVIVCFINTEAFKAASHHKTVLQEIVARSRGSGRSQEVVEFRRRRECKSSLLSPVWVCLFGVFAVAVRACGISCEDLRVSGQSNISHSYSVKEMLYQSS